MIALVLAAAVVTAPAVPPEIAASCDQMKLAPFLSAPKKEQINNEMDLDWRIAAALAEERKAGAEVAEEATRAEAAQSAADKGRWALALLALLGLAIGVAAARRSSLPMMLAAWALVASAGAAGWHLASRSAEIAAHHQWLTARQLALIECRARVTETRRMLMHSRIAGCTHDLDEVDEDVWGWVSRFRADGSMPKVADFEKMHGEIRESLKY